MSRRTGALAILFIAALFLVVNRAAYKGYFQDDELDTVSWAPLTPAIDYLTGVLTPRFFDNNFRPVPHFFFHEAGRLFGLDFPKYVAVLQLIHLLNIWLLWMVARSLRAPPAAALLACLFFGFHMALFDAFWKPMYIFDVLCGTFCLLAILFWSQRRWVLSFAAFWLAYKSKELAVMLPAVLLCYEFWLGKRQWKPLIPFFAASLAFGLQGIFLNPNKDNNYTFRFTPDALRQTSLFYAGRVFLVPYLGFLAPLAAIPGRNRRSWFGLAMAALLFFPMLFLPGRIFSAYCYVPFAGLALALSGVAEALGPVPVLVLLLLFAPLDVRELRARRNVTLAHDNDVRTWVNAVAGFAKSKPRVDAVIWSGSVPDFEFWGVEGAIHYLLRYYLPVANASSPQAAELAQKPYVAYVIWNQPRHQGTVLLHAPDSPVASWLDFNDNTPLWQLEHGWFDQEANYRWTEPVATALLSRPAGARVFAMHVLAGPERLQMLGPITLRVWLNNEELPPRRFTQAGWQDVQWEIPPADAGRVEMKLQADPPFRAGDRVLGIAVGAFGFR